MNADAATWWWLVAGALVAAELASGTFYLLLLALGSAAGALAAHGGAGGTVQVLAAAVVGGGATAGWSVLRARRPRAAAAERNRDVNLDIGQPVHVDAWAADGTARVHYRGAVWSARHAGADTPSAGPCVIVAVQGNELQLAPAHPQ